MFVLSCFDYTKRFVAGQGLEPRLPRPKRGVLPLDDPAANPLYNTTTTQSR